VAHHISGPLPYPFASIAVLLCGWYWEDVLFEDGDGEPVANLVNQPLWPRFLKKNYCHAIGRSKPGTITLVLSGPWGKEWKEYFPEADKTVIYGWGRKVLSAKKGRHLP
jgi:hypothetical protein